jgi:hypothetical protein
LTDWRANSLSLDSTLSPSRLKTTEMTVSALASQTGEKRLARSKTVQYPPINNCPLPDM